jgi:GMP synthase (glutamine-hydrolysing)
VRLLLIQARLSTDPVLPEERRSFADAARVPLEAVESWNVVDRGAPRSDALKTYDGFLVGGSGDFLVSERNMPYIEETLRFLVEVVELGTPMFASCFGFQCLVEALGGTVVYDPDHAEVGTYDVTLTEEGKEDLLFGQLSSPFAAQLGRKDRADGLPEGVVNLAFSEACPSQAFRVLGRPVWASQFHPELTEETNRGRFYRYLRNYRNVMGPGALRDTAASFRPSPEPGRLLSRFVCSVIDS